MLNPDIISSEYTTPTTDVVLTHQAERNNHQLPLRTRVTGGKTLNSINKNIDTILKRRVKSTYMAISRHQKYEIQ